MTGEAEPPVLTARRAPQHVRLLEAYDAYERVCILTNTTKPSPVSASCSQIHRFLAVATPLLRVWVHCPRASNGLLPRRSNLVGYVRWDARSDRFPPCQTIIPTAFRSQSGLPVIRPELRIRRCRVSGQMLTSAVSISTLSDGGSITPCLAEVLRLS